MRRYKGTFDNFFGIEHRLRKEEMEEQFDTKRQRKDGDLRRMQQGSLRKRQQLRSSCGQKKERLSRFQKMKEESPKLG